MKKSAVALTLGLAVAISSCGEKKNNNSNNNKPATVKPVDTNTDTNTDTSTDANTDNSCSKSDYYSAKCVGSKIYLCNKKDDNDDKYAWEIIDDCGSNKCVTYKDDGNEEIGCSCDPATFVPNANNNYCSDSGYGDEDSVTIYEFEHEVCTEKGSVHVVSIEDEYCRSCNDGICHITDADLGINAEEGTPCIPLFFRDRCVNDTAYHCAQQGKSVGIVVKEQCAEGCDTYSYLTSTISYCSEMCDNTKEYDMTFVIADNDGCAKLERFADCFDGQPLYSGFSFVDFSDDTSECNSMVAKCEEDPEQDFCDDYLDECADPDEDSNQALCRAVSNACSQSRQAPLYNLICISDIQVTMCADESSEECAELIIICKNLYEIDSSPCMVKDDFDFTTVKK